MGIYEKNIMIKGRHATRMKALASKFDDNLTNGLFVRNLDVYLTAPIVGKIYGRKAEVDTTDGDTTTIHTEQMNREMDNLLSNFRLLTILENKDVVDLDERISNAFRYDRDDQKRQPIDESFEAYLLGGIDVLYEKLVESSHSTEDYVKNLFDFYDDFRAQYANKIDFEKIDELCAKVKQ